jgi:hypothetical protein
VTLVPNISLTITFKKQKNSVALKLKKYSSVGVSQQDFLILLWHCQYRK